MRGGQRQQWRRGRRKRESMMARRKKELLQEAEGHLCHERKFFTVVEKRSCNRQHRVEEAHGRVSSAKFLSLDQVWGGGRGVVISWFG